MNHKRWLNLFFPCLVFLGFNGLWALSIQLFEIEPWLLPGPIEVYQHFLNPDESSRIFDALTLTAMTAFSGWVLSGLLGYIIALSLSLSKTLELSFSPYIVIAQTLPVVAIAPLIAIWVENGFIGSVIISFILSLFPVISNTTLGLKSLPKRYHELFQLYRATQKDFYLKCLIPFSLPSFAAGLRISAGLSLVGAIVGEFFLGLGGHNQGLGYYIFQYSSQTKTSKLIPYLIAGALVGICFFLIASLFEKWIKRRLHLIEM